MFTHNSARQSDYPWTIASQPWATENAPSIASPLPAAATPVRSVSRGWEGTPVLVLFSILLCCLAVVAAVQGLDLVLGAGAQRVQVCNRFDSTSATAHCAMGDSFIIVRDGATSASLRISVPRDSARPRVPVTIEVSETNGTGLMVADGSSHRVLQPDGMGVAVLPLQDVFAAARIPLPAPSAGSPNWERVTYTVQVRARTTILGDAVFHAAL
jgi:hypothetical protein